jgi:hypothetical protein
MSLNTVQDIECAIDALTPEQREELCLWLDEHYPHPVDVQLKADIEAGHFDKRISRAIADHKTGKPVPFSGRPHAPHQCGLLQRVSGVAR